MQHGRRRFFPARRVQTVPGRSVELEMQLRPGAAAPEPAALPPAPPEPPPPAGGCVCDVHGVAWLVHPESIGDWWAVMDTFDAIGRVTHLTAQVSPYGMTRHLVGVIEGVTLCDASWEYVWELPPPLPAWGPYDDAWLGHETTVRGNIIDVQLHGLASPNADREVLDAWRARLIARAYCGGEQVGELHMTAVLGEGV